MLCNVLCFRFVGRAGHCYGPTEPNFKYELHGSLYETGRSLAEAGQLKAGRTGVKLLLCLFVRHFSDSDLHCFSGLCQILLYVTRASPSPHQR